MFTGIIECLGKVTEIEQDKSNKRFIIESPISSELKVDQSVSHNGVCLTIENTEDNFYQVTAVDETLKKSNLNFVKVGDLINLERSVKVGDRLDGHIVQGHVDGIATCTEITEVNGSWRFKFNQEKEGLIVDKGSITLNGISLTVVDPSEDHFYVAIIPYTYNNTNFSRLKEGDEVNIEYDVIGKYVSKLMLENN